MYSRLKVKFCLSPMQHTRCLSVTFYSVLIIWGLHASFLFYSQMILIMRERVWENNEELEDISDYTPLPKLGLGQTYWRKMWLSDELLWRFLHPHLSTHFTKMIIGKKGGGLCRWLYSDKSALYHIMAYHFSQVLKHYAKLDLVL